MKLRKMFVKEFSSLHESNSFVEQLQRILDLPESECIIFRNQSSDVINGHHLRYGMDLEISIYNNAIFEGFHPCVEILIYHLDDLSLNEILPYIFMEILSKMKEI